MIRASLALLLLGCGSGSTPLTEPDEEADPTPWTVEGVAVGEGLYPRILRGPDDRIHVISRSEWVLSNDIECARGALEYRTTTTHVLQNGAWIPGLSVSHAPGPESGAVAALDPTGALWLAAPTGEEAGGFIWCGPMDLTLVTEGAAPERLVEGRVQTEAETGRVLPDSQTVGRWPALAFDPFGRPMVAHQRTTLGAETGSETHVLEVAASESSVPVGWDGADRLPALAGGELLMVGGASLHALSPSGVGWSRARLATAPKVRAPDLVELPDGDVLGSMIDVNGGPLVLRRTGGIWTADVADFRTPDADRLAVDAHEDWTAWTWSDGADVHLVLDGPEGRIQELIPGLPTTCIESDIVLGPDAVHLAIDCPDTTEREPSLWVATRRLP